MKFSGQLDALKFFTRNSYRNIKLYFTSKPIEHTQKKIKDSGQELGLDKILLFKLLR